MDENTRQAMRLWTLAQSVVSAHVMSVVRDFRDRDDVLQEVAIAVIEFFPAYDPNRFFNGWAIGVARNKIGTYLRERRLSKLVFDGETVELLAAAFEKISPEQVQQLDYLHDCLGTLEGRARKLCELRYASDLKPAMIAGLVGMNANTVAKSLQRIREQLRSCVEHKAALDGASP